MLSVSLLEAGAKRLRELRKWTLAPLGAVLFVFLSGALVVGMIASGGGPSSETLIRKYFTSRAGGGATPEQVRRIQVRDCRQTNRVVRKEFVTECTVIWSGRRYGGCFALSRDRVVLGSRQLASLDSGCDRLFWDQGAGMLVTR
jgi:hypothetical protein